MAINRYARCSSNWSRPAGIPARAERPRHATDEVLFIDDHAELGNGQRVVRAKHLHGDMVGAGSLRRLRRRPPSATRAIGDSRLRRR